jgi:hypothetical protein
MSWHFAVARSFLHGNALTGILTQLHCALAAFPEYLPVASLARAQHYSDGIVEVLHLSSPLSATVV